MRSIKIHADRASAPISCSYHDIFEGDNVLADGTLRTRTSKVAAYFEGWRNVIAEYIIKTAIALWFQQITVPQLQ